MKKLLALVLSIAMLATMVLAFASCGKEEEKPTLIVGFDAEYPPFTYEEGGEYVGFDIEYAKAVCNKIGYQIKLKAIDWNAKDQALESGDIDCIWSGFTYEGRESKYAWTVRYLDNTIVVITKTGSGINTLDDLANKIVGVQDDSSGETALKDNTALVTSLKNGTYSVDSAYTTCFEKLQADAYDAIVVDVGVCNFLIGTSTEYKVLTQNLSTETYGVGFRTSDVVLAKTVSDAMEEVAADTTFIQGLCDKYGVEYSSFTLGK